MKLPFIGPGLVLHPDNISLVMAAFAVFMTLCAALFAHGYGVSRDKRLSRFFWTGLWSFGFFAVLTVMAGDWFSLTIFLELSTVSLFIMVCVEDVRTAIMYLITQFAGAGLLLVGVGILFRDSGSVALGPVTSSALPFFILGLGVKAALPGLHYWLPRTHSRAPTPASVLLSGFAVKMGIYGLIRLSSTSTAPLFLFLGLIMALYGVIQAILQHDSKRLLAFHTFSQLGFVMSALGSGTETGVFAALFYSLAHGIFKGLLFCSAGVMEKRYGTRDLGQLGRGVRSDPGTFLLFLVGALAITGLPGTSGFIAKTLVKEALKGGHHSTAILILTLAGLGTSLSFSKMAYYGFLSNKSTSSFPGMKKVISQVSPSCHAAMVILAMGTVFLGISPLVFPGYFPMETHYFLSLGNMVTALVPILAGILIFSATSGTFRPLDKDIPDLYEVLCRLGHPFHFASSGLRDLHDGRLRNYLKFLLIAILTVFLFLSGMRVI